jgi:hypothetical protein
VVAAIGCGSTTRAQDGGHSDTACMGGDASDSKCTGKPDGISCAFQTFTPGTCQCGQCRSICDGVNSTGAVCQSTEGQGCCRDDEECCTATTFTVECCKPGTRCCNVGEHSMTCLPVDQCPLPCLWGAASCPSSQWCSYDGTGSATEWGCVTQTVTPACLDTCAMEERCGNSCCGPGTRCADAGALTPWPCCFLAADAAADGPADAGADQ